MSLGTKYLRLESVMVLDNIRSEAVNIQNLQSPHVTYSTVVSSLFFKFLQLQ